MKKRLRKKLHIKEFAEYGIEFEMIVTSPIKEEAFNRLKNCKLCPRNCGVNRTTGETGTCKTGIKALVASLAVSQAKLMNR